MKNYLKGIHHLGIAVRNIKKEAQSYVDSFGFKQETEILHEPPQKVNVQFLLLGDYRIELIEPTGEDSPIMNFINKGGVLNHICYETSDIENTVEYFKSEKNMFQTVPIIKASTLKDCFYTFFAKPNGEVIELIYFEG